MQFLRFDKTVRRKGRKEGKKEKGREEKRRTQDRKGKGMIGTDLE